MRAILILFVLILSATVGTYAQDAEPNALPSRYEEQRFFVEPILANGKKLNLFTDTGGGLFIYKSSAKNLDLISSEGKTTSPIDFPKFKESSSIPKPLGSKGKIYILAPKEGQKLHSNYDGMLGQHWFADRIWTFDYLNQKLILWNKTPSIIEKKSKHRVKLAFKTNIFGKRTLSFPRIKIEVDGEEIDVLFDTGATTFLTKEALEELKDERAATRATSFITNVMFEKWRKKNPKWRIIKKAESTTGEAMIEVPNLKIAGYEVGPVWFTRRANKNFHEFMSKFMDKKIEGAIGGNALHHFRITVDYPKALAVFEKCKSKRLIK